ncbi:DNA helicase [Curtobacterium sp. MCPF17_001]|nr:DNA helicase [Curtobacterium sp. MCPF17_001]
MPRCRSRTTARGTTATASTNENWGEPLMNNADHVAAGLRTLGTGLRPIVASTLEPRLRPGVSWTEILAVKDREKGGGERRYDKADLQVLLRIVTETLPRLGRPFDALLDRNGSRLAGELREIRNRWAHNAEFDDADTYRALDSVYRLLYLLGAAEQAEQAAALRRDFQVTMVGSAEAQPQVVETVRPVAPTDARTESPARSTSSTDITLVGASIVSYAMAHNRVRVLPGVTILHQRPAVRNARLTVSIDSAGAELGEPREHFFDLEPSADAVTKTDLGLTLDPTQMMGVEDSRPGRVRAVLRDGDRVLAEATADVHVLAAGQWLLVPSQVELSLEMLAAHVQPNHPALAPVMDDASNRLRSMTGDGSFVGYQQDEERVDRTVEAMVDAIRARHVRYSVPPASWSDVGQKVRTPAEVLDDRFGTCLDTATTLAAALERVGVRSMIVVVPGHAFLAYWRVEQQLPNVVMDDHTVLRNLLAEGQISVLETTMLTDEDQDASFGDIRRASVDKIRAYGLDELFGYVDLYLARSVARILPLPARVTGQDGQVTVVEYQVERTDPAAYVPPVFDGSAARADDDTPPRVRQWKNNLLDLSLRNRLINFTKTAQFPLFVASDGLAEFEDVLSAGESIELLPSDALPAVVRERGVQWASQLPDADRTTLFRTKRQLFADAATANYTRKFQALAYKAKTVVEETGSNNLYIAIGSLVWRVKGKEVRSPLILVPVTLKARARGGTYRITLDDAGASTPNYSLLEKLHAEYGLRIPELAEPAQDASGIDVNAVFAATRRAIMGAGVSATIEPTVDLAVLQFAKFRLWKDLDENWRELSENPLVKHLIDQPTEPFVGAPVDLDATASDSALDELLGELPVSADSSQLQAVAAASEGHTFVLEGPPGTGKSQTITNLLAKAIADGRRVLFVAEKRAALDVVQRRLAQVGLGPFTLDLHDKGSKPVEVRARLREALAQRPLVDTEALRRASDNAAVSRGRLARYAVQLHAENAAGRSFYSARNAELATGDTTFELEVPLPVAGTVTSAQLHEIRTVLRELPDLALRAKPRPDHSWAFVDPSDEAADAADLAQRVRRFDAAVAGLPSDDVVLEAVLTATTTADARLLVAVLQAPPVDAPVLEEARTERWRSAVDSLGSETAGFADRFTDVLSVLRPDVLRMDLPRIAHDAATAQESGVFGRKKRVAAVAQEFRSVLQADVELDHARLVPLARRAAEMQEHARSLGSRVRSVPGIDVDAAWSPLEHHDRVSVARQVDDLTQLVRATDTASASDEDRRFRAALERCATRVGPVDGTVLAAVHEYAGALADLLDMPHATPESWRRWLQDVPLLERWSATAAGRDGSQMTAVTPLAWLQWRHALRTLRVAGMTAAYDALLIGAVPAEEAIEAFERGLAAAMRRERAQSTGLEAFDAPGHVRHIDRYTAAALEVRDHLPRQIPHQVVERRSFTATNATGPAGRLVAEIGKQRSRMKLREMMSTYGEVITELTPCVLVSPDSVARFFEAKSGLFDLVVFDEASQVRVADAIGAMGRARAVVVVGDSKQMPPTSFAEAALGDDEDDESPLESVAVDEESILAECVQARVDRYQLTWHYRSQDESLIAFSNRHYYEDQLTSFPAPALGTADDGLDGHGVSLRRVDGTFIRAGAGATAKSLRTNPVEAAAIVAEVHARFAHSPESLPSLGVVTFNAQQRALVEELLRSSGDERISEALDTAVDGLFVKNLENVQGDERDTILFSTAFSKNEKGVLPLNFGPLTNPGGERRLNVAITRARRQVILFSSFDPQDLRTEETNSVGIKHLRSYLELAQRGPDAVLGAPSSVGLTDRHREEIAEALRARGLAVTTDVGLSDFKVDIAVASASAPDSPVVAVLLDTAAWADRATVADRDALPTEVLQGLMHWPSVQRVWLPEWLSSHDVVLDRIVAAAQRHSGDVLALLDKQATAGTHTGSQAGPISAVTGEAPSLSASENANGGGPSPQVASTTAGTPVPQLANTAHHRREEPRHTAGTEPEGSVGESPMRLDASVGSVEPFVPWVRRTAGVSTILRDVRQPDNASLVQSVIYEVVQAEGPVSARTLVAAVAEAFLASELTEEEEQAILELVPPMFRWSADERFVWPVGLAPEQWNDFRVPSAGSAERLVESVSLREIINAMRHVLQENGALAEDILRRETHALFGGRRMSSAVLGRMTEATVAGVASGRLRRTEVGTLTLP